MFFDSTMAMNSIVGEQKRSTNSDLYELQRSAWLLWEDLRVIATVGTKHVYSHAGILPNELADQLADDGRLGEVVYRASSINVPFGSEQARMMIGNLPHNVECSPNFCFRR